MPNYKEMYLKLFRATEEAISTLIAAQQECEELYIRSFESEIKDLPNSCDKEDVSENDA